MVILNSDSNTSQLPYLQDQKLLTLRWRLLSQWGSDHVACCFAYKGRHYNGYAR